MLSCGPDRVTLSRISRGYQIEISNTDRCFHFQSPPNCVVVDAAIPILGSVELRVAQKKSKKKSAVWIERKFLIPNPFPANR